MFFWLWCLPIFLWSTDFPVLWKIRNKNRSKGLLKSSDCKVSISSKINRKSRIRWFKINSACCWRRLRYESRYRFEEFRFDIFFLTFWLFDCERRTVRPSDVLKIFESPVCTGNAKRLENRSCFRFPFLCDLPSYRRRIKLPDVPAIRKPFAMRTKFFFIGFY